ncbi:hypothetical protein D3C86_1761790 [compost metagenome]
MYVAAYLLVFKKDNTQTIAILIMRTKTESKVLTGLKERIFQDLKIELENKSS